MKKLITVATSAFLTFNSFASTLDVKPINGLKNGDPYVRITKLKNSRVQVEKCISGQEVRTCEKLGRKNSYSIKELRSQRTQEYIEEGLSFTVDLALMFGGATTLIYAAGVAATAGTSPLLCVSIPVIGGVAVPAAVKQAYDKKLLPALKAFDPIEQDRQAESINEEVINDKDVQIARNDMNDFIERLDLVLSKI